VHCLLSQEYLLKSHVQKSICRDFTASIESQPIEILIGAGDSILTWLINPHLAKLQGQFPGTIIKLSNLRSTAIVERLERMRLDSGDLRDLLVEKLIIPKN